MAPIKINASDACMEKVTGIKTATAIVAVNPGNAPTKIPATTPPKAKKIFAGINALSKPSITIILPI